MAINTNDPVDGIGDFFGNLQQQFCHIGNLCAPLRAEIGAGAVKQDLRRKHETVAHDPHAITPLKHLSQATKEIGSVAFQTPGFCGFEISTRALLGRHLRQSCVQSRS